MNLQRPRWLEFVLNPKLAIPVVSAMIFVALAAGLRAILGGGWLVPIIVALGLALIVLVIVLVVMLFRQER